VHLLVSVDYPGVEVPMEFVEDGQIVLNITPGAVQNFHMDLSLISFAARFRGIAHEVLVPVEAILAIFAKENGQGMAFEIQATPDEPPPSSPDTPIKGGKARLKVVK
jgi:stringent starvation protein B